MEIERPRVSKDMSSTMYTSSSNTNVLIPLIQNITTYEEGLAILQYCRLVHKTC